MNAYSMLSNADFTLDMVRCDAADGANSEKSTVKVVGYYVDDAGRDYQKITARDMTREEENKLFYTLGTELFGTLVYAG